MTGLETTLSYLKTYNEISGRSQIIISIVGPKVFTHDQYYVHKLAAVCGDNVPPSAESQIHTVTPAVTIHGSIWQQ